MPLFEIANNLNYENAHNFFNNIPHSNLIISLRFQDMLESVKHASMNKDCYHEKNVFNHNVPFI